MFVSVDSSSSNKDKETKDKTLRPLEIKCGIAPILYNNHILTSSQSTYQKIVFASSVTSSLKLAIMDCNCSRV
jgi:hypothetical protein